MTTTRAKPTRLALAAAVALCANAALAGEWTYTPRLSASAMYSDNVLLTAQNPQSDVVFQVRPGFSVRGQGARLQGALDVNLDRRETLNGRGNESNNRQWQAQGDAEIWEDLFFFNARSIATQVNVDNRLRVTDDNRLGGGTNSTNVTTYSLSPYLRHRFAGYADAELRPTYTSVSNEQDSNVGGGQAFANSDSRVLAFRLVSGTHFAKAPWNFSVDRSRVEFDTGASNTFQRMQFNVGYQYSRKWLFDVTVGRERNEFASSRSTDGSILTVGFDWTPNDRTNVDVSWGERFFGRTASANVSYRKRFTRFNLNYSDQILTTNQLFSQFNPTRAGDFNSFATQDPALFNNVGVRTDTPTLNDNVFLLRQLRSTLGWSKRRNSADVSAFWTSRTDQGGGEAPAAPTTQRSADQTSYGLNASAGHQLSTATSLRVDTSWQYNQFDSDGADNTFTRMGASINHNLSQYLSLNLRYSHLRRSGGGGGRGVGGGGGGALQSAQDFTENSVMLALAFRL